MQMNDETLMSIVERAKENRMLERNTSLNCELECFFENVMDTVVEYFEMEKA